MRARGFTLIELMVTLAVVAILLLFATPAFVAFIANAKTRNVAEAIVEGMRLAQSTAVDRNTTVRYSLTEQGYRIVDTASGTVLRSGDFVEAGSGAPVLRTEPEGASAVTFTGFGRILANNPPVAPETSASDAITRIHVTAASAGSRTLGVVVSALGQDVRMCDPNPRFTYKGSTDPAACPFPW
ncbi:MAG: GspH/FimT family pseudopilin [Burkholderiales bacterium]